MPEHMRADDFTIGALVAELKAHREEFSRYREMSEAWRVGMELRAKTMDEFIAKMNTPIKIIWGCISVAVVSFIGAFVTWTIHWFGKHWTS